MNGQHKQNDTLLTGALPLYVIFTRSSEYPGLPWWWRRWRDGQGSAPTHCFPMRWTGRGWIAFDVTIDGIDIEEISTDPDLPRVLVAEGARVIRAYRAPRPKRMRWRGFITCTSAVKFALGIKAPFVITPGQLLNWLLLEGHIEVVVDGSLVPHP